jgi:hypothetical protein
MKMASVLACLLFLQMISAAREELRNYKTFLKAARETIFPDPSTPSNIRLVPFRKGVANALSFAKSATAADYDEIANGLSQEKDGNNFLCMWSFLIEAGTDDASAVAARARRQVKEDGHRFETGPFPGRVSILNATFAPANWREHWMEMYPELRPK